MRCRQHSWTFLPMMLVSQPCIIRSETKYCLWAPFSQFHLTARVVINEYLEDSMSQHYTQQITGRKKWYNDFKNLQRCPFSKMYQKQIPLEHIKRCPLNKRINNPFFVPTFNESVSWTTLYMTCKNQNKNFYPNGFLCFFPRSTQ